MSIHVVTSNLPLRSRPVLLRDEANVNLKRNHTGSMLNATLPAAADPGFARGLIMAKPPAGSRAEPLVGFRKRSGGSTWNQNDLTTFGEKAANLPLQIDFW